MKKPISLLIVDDDHTLREVLCYYFETLGHKVHKASSGNEAIEKLNAEKIEAVLTDADMPDGNGFDVVRHCDLNGVPVLMHSGGHLEHRSLELQKIVGKRFIRKPAYPDVILTKLSELLEPTGT